jgi:hypothetical protein
MPHMHFYGAAARVDLVRADGSRECMVDVPRWDPHWQQLYWLQDPLETAAPPAAADAFEVRCAYDTTAARRTAVEGLRASPHDVTTGTQATDEMCTGMIFVTDAADPPPMP